MSEHGEGGERTAETAKGGFLDELRRRGVRKAALLYAAVGWAVIEATSVIMPALKLPEWSVTFVVVLVLIGFPVTLVFAWVFDLTRQGVVRTPALSELPHDHTQALRRGRLIDFLIIAVLLGLVTWLGWEKMFGGPEDAAVGGFDSIAVLPFANLSADPENEFFGDGLAEEILNALVGVDGLRVAARTSSFEYKGQNLDVRRIGAALGVANVLEGSVRRSGDRVRVTAQLIRSNDGFHLWSRTYDGSMSDIFALQDEISGAITEALRPQLGYATAVPHVVRQTKDVLAYEAYLRGRHAMHKRSAESLNQALDDFRTAIGRDPEYAAAYSGLSDTYVLLAGYGDLDAVESRRLAEPMARRALELDSDLAEAQASWGLLLRDRGDYEASLAPLQRAIELNPSYSTAYHWLGLSFQSLGRYREANEVLRQTLKIDPQYTTGKRVLMGNLRQMGEDEEADRLAGELERDLPNDINTLKSLMWDAQMRDPLRSARLASRLLRLDPASVDARSTLSLILFNVGDIEGSRKQMEIAARHDPDHMAVQLVQMRFAMFEGKSDDLEARLGAYLDSVSDPIKRRELACNLLQGSMAARLILRNCALVLEGHGWVRGQALPAQSSQVAAMMLIAAYQANDQDWIDVLEPLVEAEFRRLAGTGHSLYYLDLSRAQIELYRGNPDPILDQLPELVNRQLTNLEMALHDPVVAAIAGDPRFVKALEATRARQAELREGLARIDLRVD